MGGRVGGWADVAEMGTGKCGGMCWLAVLAVLPAFPPMVPGRSLGMQLPPRRRLACCTLPMQLCPTPELLMQGPATPFALKRTFGQPGEPIVKLYRDHAAWCPCEQSSLLTSLSPTCLLAPFAFWRL